jgi:hypothetical protein
MTEEQINQLTRRLEKLEKQYEELCTNVELIDHKHENVMSSVLEHLVHQSNVLKDHVSEWQSQNTINKALIDTSTVCSAEYTRILQHEHESGGWGVAASMEYSRITEFLEQQHVYSILDYGAGSANRLSKLITQSYPGKYLVTDYDPAVPEINQEPVPHDLVFCIDVLEHVEPELINNVLDHLQNLVLVSGYFTIFTQPARRILSDGRNAHLIIQPAQWWVNQLEKRFSISHYSHQQGGLLVIVAPK